MSDAGLARTATHSPRSVPSTSTTRPPIRSCTQSASGSSSGSAYSGSLAKRSAAVRSRISRNFTTRRPFEATRAVSTVSSPVRVRTAVPGVRRAGSSDRSWTNTSPRRPWARRMCPISRCRQESSTHGRNPPTENAATLVDLERRTAVRSVVSPGIRCRSRHRLCWRRRERRCGCSPRCGRDGRSLGRGHPRRRGR